MDLTKLEDWDAFDKVDDAFVHRTQTGAYASILVTAILLFLGTSEVSRFLSPKHSYLFTVDHTVRQKVNVGVDVTVAMKCEYLTMNTFDLSGSTNRIDQDMEKISTLFSSDGVFLHGDRPHDPILGSSPIDNLSAQPKLANSGTPVTPELSNACRIRGSFSLNKVAGNVHITALGHIYKGKHVPLQAVNFTHRIDSFIFGHDVSHHVSLSNPLSASYEVSDTHFEFYQYFLSVVPTTLIVQGNLFSTNQYGVTDHKRVFDVKEPLMGQGVPGIFFRYDFEPIAVQITVERSESILRFLVRMEGIIGGVYVSTSITYSLMHTLISLLKKTSRQSVMI